ncbi:MAG: hypothetical protein R3D27_05855 [Hyphomicrobiaceae bacterium]
MTTQILRALVATAILITALALGRPAEARESRWVLLGEHRVGFQADRDVIRLNRDEGWFRALRLDAERNDVYVFKLTLVYLNGYREEIPVNRMLRAGERSPSIDLNAERSFIREIELSYRSRPNYRGEPAVVQVYADQSRDNTDTARNRYRDDEFRELVEETVNLGEREVVLRPRRAGRVGAIRLRARDNAVFVRRVEIEFRNGERQVEQLQQAIEQGRPSRAIDLAGDRRAIASVTVVMRPQPSRRTARLELLGREEAEAPAAPAPSAGNRVGRPPRLDANGVPVSMVLFGSGEVGRRGDRDVIAIGRDKGQFDEIALRVLGSDVEINRITIVYGNGERDAIDINQTLRANTVTSKLRLDGNRFLREIELDYRKVGRERGRATVELYGDYSDAWKRRGRDNGAASTESGWLLLGQQKAQMGRAEGDVFEVGRDKGRFRALSLIARRRSVEIRAIRVVYANGEVEDVPLTGPLADGKLMVDEASDPIDLKGRQRSIDRVEIVHRTKFNLKGSGVIELWGLKTEARFRDGDGRDVLKRELGRALKNLMRQ